MNIVQALALMRRAPLPMPSAAEDLALLYPAVIPAAWLDGSAWIPGLRLPAGELALAWMLRRDLPTFVSRERVAEWEAAGHAWQRQGFRNLRAANAEERAALEASIRSCWQGDDASMVPRLWTPQDAAVPASWLE